MNRSRCLRDERGIALITVLLLGFAVSAIALAGSMWILNAALIQQSGERTAVLNGVAVAGLEEGRSRLSSDPAVYPTAGYATLEDGVPVQDALGATIPRVRRWTYAGPDGVTSGQYGVYGSILTVAKDDHGNQLVRRLQINQESFAKYAYFTTIEGNIVFANNDQIRGPVHSNDEIEIHPSRATFFDEVTSAASAIRGRGNADFRGPPPRTSVPPIPLPGTAAFGSLQTRAQTGGMSFAGNTLGSGSGEASIRLEFVALDLNADGDSTDTNEGFVRIYQDNSRPWYVTGSRSGLANGDDIRRSPNCGTAIVGTGSGQTDGRFRTAADTNPTGSRNAAATNLLTHSNRRCYLGGDPRLKLGDSFSPTTADWAAAWDSVDGDWAGSGAGWRRRPAGIGAPTTIAAFTSRYDADFLWPINRTYNPAWEGVIYVSGRVAISGVLNGRVTLASPENIIVADDLRMATDPGSAAAANCADMLGIFSGRDVVMANNTLNAPQQINGSGSWRTYDDTSEEYVHAVVLALATFAAEDHDEAPDNAEDCGATHAGRGCLYLTGGIIQRSRGAVGLTSGRGYVKRYAYNACAASDPPPYFPTTGRFVRNRTSELDPRAFDVAAWFTANQNN